MQSPVVFITGAEKNTGYAIACRFAAEEYSVIISSRNLETIEKTAAEIRDRYGVSVLGVELDISNLEAVKTVFNRIRQEFGRLDVFVANAANQGVGNDFLEAEPEEFEAVVNVNLRGSYFCSQQAARIMKEQGGGSIIFMGSIHRFGGVPGRSLYGATKGGLYSLSRTIAIELAPYGIRSNYITAGAIHTDRWDADGEEKNDLRRRNYPTGREVSAEEVAEAVYFFASDAAKNVTGSELTVDSGLTVNILPYNGGQR